MSAPLPLVFMHTKCVELKKRKKAKKFGAEKCVGTDNKTTAATMALPNAGPLIHFKCQLLLFI